MLHFRNIFYLDKLAVRLKKIKILKVNYFMAK
jgi:hypothetical protein